MEDIYLDQLKIFRKIKRKINLKIVIKIGSTHKNLRNPQKSIGQHFRPFHWNCDCFYSSNCNKAWRIYETFGQVWLAIKRILYCNWWWLHHLINFQIIFNNLLILFKNRLLLRIFLLYLMMPMPLNELKMIFNN